MLSDTLDEDMVTIPRSFLTRLQVEEFVYREAVMLDAWAMDEWLALFTEECSYEVTSPGLDDPEGADRRTVYFLIGDNRERLENRIIRMKNPAAHVEHPRSKTRHLYSNVLVDEDDGTNLTVRLNFITTRNKRGTVQYFGKIRYKLVRDGNSFKIAAKRIMMDIDQLVPQGKVSIFL